MALSLRGIARRYGNVTGSFSVVQAILNGNATGTVSLRSRLESMAREEISFGCSECTFGWTAAFEQIWSHIRIRIKLNPDDGITSATLNTLRATWQQGIEDTWSNQWGCGRSDEVTCPLTFEVVWVNTGEHHTVRVNTGIKCTDAMGNPMRCPTNKGRWHTDDSGAVAAHEYGHMLGHPDEYIDTNTPCPDRKPVNTGTIMDNNSANIPERLMTRFADNIGSNVVAI